MGYLKEPEGVVLHVEQREPTEEEERLFRDFMQNRQSKRTAPTKKVLQPTVTKKRTPSATASDIPYIP
jgi:hypothetical protein